MTPDVERLAALSTLSCDALVLVDATGHIEWVSPSIAALLGYGSDDLRGRRVDDLVEPDALEAWEAFVHDVETRPRVALRVQFRCRHRDGTSRWVEATGQNLLGEPAVGAIVVRLRESTGRRASAATADPGDERTFRAMVEGSLVSVFIAQNDRLVYVNPTGAALLGYTVTELLDLPNAFTLVHEQDRGFVIDRLAELGRPGTPTEHLTFRGRRKDGGVVQVEAFFAVSEHRGQAATFVTVLDIGDRVRVEDQLRQAQKLEAVSRLAGGIAHDFNNLLASIRGNAELIGHKIDRDASAHAEVAEILAAADRAASLTRQLLAFSRNQATEPTMLDLNGLVRSVSRMARRLMGSQILVDEDLALDLAQVRADPAHLEQVLLNLIVNARDAMPDGGRICIGTATVTLARGSAEQTDSGLSPGRYVQLLVQDEGVGMDPATQARVFEPFFTTREPGRGTGLGLSTVYGLLRQSGGAITVTSAPQRGATFVVYLPAVHGDPA